MIPPFTPQNSNPTLASLFHRLSRIHCNAKREEHVKNPALIGVALKALQQNRDYLYLLTTNQQACDFYNGIASLCHARTISLIERNPS